MTRRADHRLNGGGKSRTSSSAEKFLLAPPVHSTQPRTSLSGGRTVFVNLGEWRSKWVVGNEFRVSSAS